MYSLVGPKKECGGSEKNKGRMDSIDECAKACKGLASMFVFGTNDFEVDRCNAEGCTCYCETAAKDDGTCQIVDHNGFRLYRFDTSGK